MIKLIRKLLICFNILKSLVTVIFEFLLDFLCFSDFLRIQSSTVETMFRTFLKDAVPQLAKVVIQMEEKIFD